MSLCVTVLCFSSFIFVICLYQSISAKVDSNLLKNTKGNSANDIDTTGDDNKDFTIPIPSLGVSMFSDSKWQAELAR